MKQHFAILVVFIFSLLLFQNSEAAIRCNDVIKDLTPCASYIMSGSGNPSSTCCSGVSTLASAAATTADRRTACSCIMSVVAKVKPNITAAQALPGSCGITFPFTVSPNMDCSKYDRLTNYWYLFSLSLNFLEWIVCLILVLCLIAELVELSRWFPRCGGDTSFNYQVSAT